MPTATPGRVLHDLDIESSRPAHVVVADTRNQSAVAPRSHFRVVTTAPSGVVHRRANCDYLRRIRHTTERRTRLRRAYAPKKRYKGGMSVDGTSTLLCRVIRHSLLLRKARPDDHSHTSRTHNCAPTDHTAAATAAERAPPTLPGRRVWRRPTTAAAAAFSRAKTAGGAASRAASAPAPWRSRSGRRRARRHELGGLPARQGAGRAQVSAW